MVVSNNSLSLQQLFTQVKGKVLPQFNVGKLTFFKTTGIADYLFIPQDINDLQFFLSHKPKYIPIFLLGAGSNVLIRQGGIKGVVIKLNFFNQIKLLEHNQLLVGAGVSDKALANFAQHNGIGGLEFLYTIPGTIGGAAAMNAGAYHTDISQIFISAKVLDLNGQLHTFTKLDDNFSYRNSRFKHNYIILEVKLQGSKSNPQDILTKMHQLEEYRVANQPLAHQKTAGSTFKNPANYKAWQLIKQANAHILSVGGAVVSDKHCNFLLNKNNASAQDIEELGNKIKEKVYKNSKIQLEWEIEIVGTNNS